MIAVAVGDLSQIQAELVAVLAIVAFMIPVIGGVIIVGIQQIGRINDAWLLAMRNHDTLTKEVVPAVTTLAVESAAAHKEILDTVHDVKRQVNGHTSGA